MSDGGQPSSVLAQRVALLEAERDVRNLLAAYSYAADGCRDDDWVELFTEDAVIDTTYEVDGVEIHERWEGRAEMRAYIAAEAHHHQYYGRTMHLHSINFTVAVDGDVAIVHAYSLNLRAPRGGGDVIVAHPAMNRWTLVKTDSGWRFRERMRRVVGIEEAWDLIGARVK